MSHTPGPWIYLRRGHFSYEVVTKGETIAHPVGEDNARLISAAPDLLKALKLITKHLNPPKAFGYQPAWFVDAVMAIEKAEGKKK